MWGNAAIHLNGFEELTQISQQISSQLLGNDVAVAEVAFLMDIKTPKLIVEKCCHFSCKGELNCKPRPENLIVL